MPCYHLCAHGHLSATVDEGCASHSKDSRRQDVTLTTSF